ncbi:hypothetical protein GCM10025857_48100 [Alicyclobacillus contaminans]|nr:hypothetical protein GCM10025857_48100 [Alicyclobacillus contaminans]
MLTWQVEKFIKEKELLQENERVLVGVSTGVDSMVLLHILETLQKKIGFDIGVAHVNHKLRTASDEEEIYLKNYCQKHNLLFIPPVGKTFPRLALKKKRGCSGIIFLKKQ